MANKINVRDGSMKGVNGFTFFKNYYDAITDPDNGLTAEEQGELYNAIFAYMFEDILPSLKGACRMAFNLIKPSLDKSKARSAARSKEEETEPREEETTIKKNQTQSNDNQKKSNEIKPQSNEKKTDLSSSRIKKNEQEREYEERTKKNEQEREEGAGGGENPLSATERTERSFVQEKFFKEHPEIEVKNYSAGLAAEIDFEVLSAEISKSKYLRGTKSFAWLCRNYREIALGQYRDYAKSTDPPTEDTSAEQEREREWNEKHGKGAGT